MVLAFDAARWEALAAARTRGDVGDGIARSRVARPAGLISFAGGFPDPQTFPRDGPRPCSRSLRQPARRPRFSTRRRAGSPERGHARGPARALQGSRPADDELMITSGGIEALELIAIVPRPAAT